MYKIFAVKQYRGFEPESIGIKYAIRTFTAVNK